MKDEIETIFTKLSFWWDLRVFIILNANKENEVVKYISILSFEISLGSISKKYIVKINNIIWDSANIKSIRFMLARYVESKTCSSPKLKNTTKTEDIKMTLVKFENSSIVKKNGKKITNNMFNIVCIDAPKTL